MAIVIRRQQLVVMFFFSLLYKLQRKKVGLQNRLLGKNLP
jgi:hypothetical protein